MSRSRVRLPQSKGAGGHGAAVTQVLICWHAPLETGVEADAAKNLVIGSWTFSAN